MVACLVFLATCLFHCMHRSALWVLDGVYALTHWADCLPQDLLAFLRSAWAENTCWKPHFCCHGNFYWSHLFFLWTFNGRERVVLWKIDFHFSLLYLHLWLWQKAALPLWSLHSPRTFCVERTRELEVWYWSIFFFLVSEAEQLGSTLWQRGFNICAHCASINGQH